LPFDFKMTKLWQALISGMAVGSIYALIAQGYYITSITTNTLNFGQGDFLMIGALFGLTCYLALGGPSITAFILAAILAIGLLAMMGAALERIAVRPVRHLTSLSWVLSTLSVAIILRNAAQLIWRPEQHPFPSPLGDKAIHLAGAGILPQEILILVVSISVMVLLMVFLRRSILGKALLAVAHNSNAAAAMGINVQRMVILAYVLSSVLAALGGVLIAPITFAYAYMGTVVGVKAFAAAILGGLENPLGILVGGLIMGVIEQVAAGINSNLKDGITFALIILILTVRPTGLLGKR
jgi:branched-chain amino acid transport system permease protein